MQDLLKLAEKYAKDAVKNQNIAHLSDITRADIGFLLYWKSTTDESYGGVINFDKRFKSGRKFWYPDCVFLTVSGLAILYESGWLRLELNGEFRKGRRLLYSDDESLDFMEEPYNLEELNQVSLVYRWQLDELNEEYRYYYIRQYTLIIPKNWIPWEEFWREE